MFSFLPLRHLLAGLVLAQAVIDGWVMPSFTARSVRRRGPVRSKVPSVEAAVRLRF